MITIAIPFYNDELYLDLAIKSVFSQTYTDWKLILISDGGTDNSLSIARSYEKDLRVTVIADGENRKLPYRLNQIAALSTTKYLARMDADDIMHPERIEKQLSIMDENPKIDVLGSNAYTIDEKNNVIGLRKKNIDDIELTKTKGFIHPSVIGKSKWFKENKYDEDAIRMEDVELWYRSVDKSNFINTSEPLMFYREIGKDYYKKYFGIYKSKKYVLSKYKNNKYWRRFFYLNRIKGCVYFIYNLFGREQILINRRNELVYPILLNYKHYI